MREALARAERTRRDVERARDRLQRRHDRLTEADSLAREDYERFAAQRRLELEAQAEEDGFRHLEHTVKRLSPPPKDTP